MIGIRNETHSSNLHSRLPSHAVNVGFPLSQFPCCFRYNPYDSNKSITLLFQSQSLNHLYSIGSGPDPFFNRQVDVRTFEGNNTSSDLLFDFNIGPSLQDVVVRVLCLKDRLVSRRTSAFIQQGNVTLRTMDSSQRGQLFSQAFHLYKEAEKNKLLLTAKQYHEILSEVLRCFSICNADVDRYLPYKVFSAILEHSKQNLLEMNMSRNNIVGAGPLESILHIRNYKYKNQAIEYYRSYLNEVKNNYPCSEKRIADIRDLLKNKFNLDV